MVLHFKGELEVIAVRAIVQSSDNSTDHRLPHDFCSTICAALEF
jgi:hypothetical protein